MKVLIDGQFYEYDTDRMTVREAFELKERTGMGLVAFEEAWDAMEPAALMWVAYLAKQRAGEQVDWNTYDFDLAAMLSDLYKAAGSEADASDPTSASEQLDAGPPATPLPAVEDSTTSAPSETST